MKQTVRLLGAIRKGIYSKVKWALGFHKNTPVTVASLLEPNSLLPIFPVTPLCYHLKQGCRFFLFFLTKRKQDAFGHQKQSFQRRQFRMWWKANACRLKPQLFPPPCQSPHSRNSRSEGWLRSCLQNQLAKEVWASEECHSSKERFGKHLLLCFLQETDLHSTPLKCHV